MLKAILTARQTMVEWKSRMNPMLRAIPRRLALGVVLLLALDIAWRQLPTTKLETAGIPIFIAYLVIGAILLGRRLGLFLFLVGMTLGTLLGFANETKIALTQMPVTFHDLAISAMNPGGLWEAVGAPLPVRIVTYAVAIVLIAIFLYLAATGITRSIRKGKGVDVAVAAALLIPAFGFSVSDFAKKHFVIVTKSELGMGLWQPSMDATLARHVGSVPYLSYSYFGYKRRKRGDIYDIAAPAQADTAEAGLAVAPVFTTSSGTQTEKPNIVFILLESTFDIGKVFKLSNMAQDRLFTANEYTRLLSPLRVNAIGGGTWVTEFETITGVDSRVFGFYGSYTHSTISPFVTHTFASYLSGKGYSTTAIYPVPGEFFNARNAYRNYGFRHFYDAKDLDFPGEWRKNKDPLIIRKAISVLGNEASQPFFAYVLTLENHSPHSCDNPGANSGSTVALIQAPKFPGNCTINEYLRRLRSTSEAVFEMRDYLETLEKKSGRPFVLVVFGDHQPHTFTSSTLFQYDFSPFRTATPYDETFIHVMSSIPGKFDCCNGTVPAFVVPSLVASMLATDPSDVYLRNNLSLYRECGPDVVGAYRGAAGSGPATKECRKAYESALDDYRKHVVHF